MGKRGRKSKAMIAEEKGISDAIQGLIDKINKIMETYGVIKDVSHLVKELMADQEVMDLVNKLRTDDSDKKLYVLLAAAILKVIKNEMEDGDGIFDIKPAEPTTPTV